MSNGLERGPSAGERNSFIYVAAALAALNGLLFGFDTGVISGAVLYIGETFDMTALAGVALGEEWVEGIVVSGALVGAIVGAAVGGTLADRLGRRRTILLSAAVFFLGSLVMAVAPTVEWLVVGRVIDGVGIGFASVVGPLYISEISPPKIRGSLVSLNQLTITTGILLSYFVNFAFSGGPLLARATEFVPAEGWRWMLGAGMVPALALGAGILFMPESPRWLLERGRKSAARDVLARTRAPSQVDEEFAEIRRTARVESRSLADVFEPWVRPALVVGVGLAVFQQVTGINTVIYYAPSILESTGFGASASILATVGIGVVNVAMTVVAILLVDRTGRRPLLLVGLSGMVVTLLFLGYAFYVPGLSGVVSWVATGSLMLYVAFFAIGLGPVFWLLVSEIYPLKVRGTAMGTATVANWASNLGVALTFPVLVAGVGTSATFWLFAGFTVVALAFTYFFVPETKGRSLEQIEADLRENALVAGEATVPDDETADAEKSASDD